jgi:hypothetical protein
MFTHNQKFGTKIVTFKVKYMLRESIVILSNEYKITTKSLETK